MILKPDSGEPGAENFMTEAVKGKVREFERSWFLGRSFWGTMLTRPIRVSMVFSASSAGMSNPGTTTPGISRTPKYTRYRAGGGPGIWGGPFDATGFTGAVASWDMATGGGWPRMRVYYVQASSG